MSTPSPTWYDLLGVEPTADAEEIRSAWRSGIADLDPTERRFVTLNEAATVLLDPARRRAYDEELRAAEPEFATQPEPAAEPGSGAAAEPEPGSGAAAEPEPEQERPAGEKPRTAPYLVSGWVLAVLTVIAVACAVLAGVLATRDPADKVVQADVQLASGSKVTEIEARAQDAVAAAKEAVVPVLSYDYRHLDADQAKAHPYLTDSYRKGYDKLFDDVVKKPAASTQTVVTTKVVSTALVRVAPDRVQVLLFVDRSRTNKASTTPVPFQDQVTLTMQRVGDRWLVDDMVTSQIPD